MTIAYCFAESDEPEKSLPSYDAEIEKKCWYIDIEGTNHDFVTISLKSVSPNEFRKSYEVKVKVRDKNGKKIYSKTFKNCYLYIFNSGHIQVGTPKFHRIIISKLLDDGGPWVGCIREKEGVW